MQSKVVNSFVRFNRWPFIQVVRQTLVVLFPVTLLGSLARLVVKSFLDPNGFFYNILGIGAWLPLVWLRTLQFVFTSVTQIFFNLLGVLACFICAYNTARFYRKDAQMAGVTGMFALLLVAYHYGRNPQMPINFHMALLGGKSLLLTLLIGYGVGQLFRWKGPDQLAVKTVTWLNVRRQAFASLWPLSVTTVLAMLVSLAINSGSFYRAYSHTYTALAAASQEPKSIWTVLLLSLALAALDWLGLGIPSSYRAPLNTTAYMANLNYALAHGSAWHVPYKYLGSTLYNSFANFGGDGLVLALIVAILLFPGSTSLHRVARWSAVPTVFNFDYSSLVGLPVILNPVFLLPFMLLPLVNIAIAAGVTVLGLIPATPYPVLLGTPGPLIGFLATNGNWGTLVFTMLLLFLDIALYLPFVRLNFQVEAQLATATLGGEHDA
ncbi:MULTISPECIES: PTS sugar transporter subunit IIC [Limosilactobacillus]|jgi:PTS system cellobiose-specific IIC component|uniref:PTS sugar transporter subunit IIC n=1 Tax=Limosilactobacillus TaxID=2742598 RepID=UPI0024B99632|nr:MULTISPECIES: PTS sugar transporter subunit IIC [Limosilactobacillus]MDM8332551.1 PTS sugar transporter subunit IIC [Limosilactobacillus pontis]